MTIEGKAVRIGYSKELDGYSRTFYRRTSGLIGTNAMYGYALGGYTGVLTAVADQITFSTQTTAAKTSANLTVAREVNCGGLSDGILYGYIVGGKDDQSTAVADQITFSTQTTAAKTSANLWEGRRYASSISDGVSYGYVCGGEGRTVSFTTSTEQLNFSTQVTALKGSAYLSEPKDYAGVLSDGNLYGHILGGSVYSTYHTSRNILTFSTQTMAAFGGAGLATKRSGPGNISDGYLYGYVLGGRVSDTVTSATAEQLSFSTLSPSLLASANLSGTRRYMASVSDGYLYGYVAGGTPSAGLVADQITFSTQTTAAKTSANLTVSRYWAAGLSEFKC